MKEPGNDDTNEEDSRLPPITIAEDDQRESENRYKAWDVVIKAASNIEKISCDAQRKNTSLSEADLVCKLSNIIINVCKDQLLPIIPPLTAPNAPNVLPGPSMAADLHHTTETCLYKIPELVNPKFVHEKNANVLEQQSVNINFKKNVLRPRTNTKKDSVHVSVNKNSPKLSVVLSNNSNPLVEKRRTFKHKQNTLGMLTYASPLLPSSSSSSSSLSSSSSSSSINSDKLTLIQNNDKQLSKECCEKNESFQRLQNNNMYDTQINQTCYFISPNINNNIFPLQNPLNLIDKKQVNQSSDISSTTTMTSSSSNALSILTMTEPLSSSSSSSSSSLTAILSSSPSTPPSSSTTTK